MAQAGFTPIITYHSTTPAAVPSNANLAPGELSVNIADMKLYTENSSGTVTLLASGDAAAGNFTTVDTTNLEVTNIKAKDGTAAATIADSTGKITVSTELDVDNLNFSGNAIISTNTDGNIDLTPNGTGEVNITKVDIDGGTIDGTTIGGSTAAAGTFTDVTLNAQGDVRFADSDSSNYVAFQAPATIASNVTWTLPAADGTSGQVLSTDGFGILSWETATGGGGGGGTSVTVTQATATASQTTFNVTYTVGQLSVYLNGALLASADYTATNGTTVVLATGAAANDIFTAVAYSTVAGLTLQSASPFGTLVGSGAGAVNTGVNNVFVGFEAGNDNTTGTNNVAVGYQALDANTTGAINTAIGDSALGANTTGGRNTALGHRALLSNTTASNNTAIGVDCLDANTTGAFNTAVGDQALTDNTTGVENVSFGYQNLFDNTTGNRNSAFGTYALYLNTTGSDNTALGRSALESNTTGANNTAVGAYALDANTTGQNNTAVGVNALGANTSGNSNVALGYNALDANTTGVNNVALGNDALGACTTGFGNVAVGLNAAGALTTGEQNVVIGYPQGFGGWALTTGAFNIFVGARPGEVVTTGSSNICFGYYANPSSATGTHQFVVGTNYGSTGKGNNTGFIDPNGGGNYQGSNSSSWLTTSDQRLKKNIVDNNEGLEVINQIRVRNFEYRLPEEVDPELKPTDAVKKPGVQIGVIAQELQEVCPDCVTLESTGVLSVDSDEIFWHMVNAIKELKAEVDALKSQINGA